MWQEVKDIKEQSPLPSPPQMLANGALVNPVVFVFLKISFH